MLFMVKAKLIRDVPLGLPLSISSTAELSSFFRYRRGDGQSVKWIYHTDEIKLISKNSSFNELCLTKSYYKIVGAALRKKPLPLLLILLQKNLRQ